MSKSKFNPTLAPELKLSFSAGTKKKTMAVSFKPNEDRVLVEPAEAEEMTASGIIIPDTAQEKPQRGKVVSVGPGKKDEPMFVQEGDVVLYGQYAGSEIKIDGASYLIMRNSDIYGVLS